MEHFLAREDEQDRFVSVLQHALDGEDGPDEGFLFVVQGHGGIGKTELLNRFGDIVRGKVRRQGVSNRFYLVAVDWSTERLNRPTDYTSWAGPPIWVALDALYVSLRDEVADWRARRRFERAFADYRSQATKIRTAQPMEPEPSHLPDILGAAIGVIGGLAPVPGAAAASQNMAKLATDLAQSAQSARGRVDDRNYDRLIGPDDALVRAFASGVREVSRRRPVVLILDTAEILGEARRRISQAVKRSGAKTVWVWGIRLEDEANAAEDSETMLLRRYVDNARLRLVPLSRFDDKTIARYLQSRVDGIPVTPELTRDVVALTRGIPLAVRLATNLLSNGVPPAVALREVSATGEVSEVISGLAKRYLVHLTQTPNLQMRTDLAFIYGLALMNGPASDPDLLAALWHVPAAEVAKRLDELAARHDFVLSGQRRMHQEIRRTIQLFLLDPVRRPEVRAANDRAVKVLRERMEGLSQITTVQAQLADEEWCADACQLLWHTFWVNIRDGLRLLAELVPAAHTLAPSVAADLLRTAHWFEPVFTAEQRAVLAGTRVLLPSGSFINRLQTEFRRAAERQDTPAVISTAMEVITAAADTPPSVLASDVPPTVFVLLLQLERPVNNDDVRSVAVLEEMVQLLPATGAQHLRDIIVSRIETLVREIVGKPGTQLVAVSVSRAAVLFAPGNAALHAQLARAYEVAGEGGLALKAIEEACRLDPRRADWRITQGLILRDLLRYEECLAAYEEACRLQPDNGGWHGNRGIALGRLGRHEDALAAYEEACRLQPQVPSRHTSRGLALRQLNRHEDALAAYEEACRLEPGNPSRLADRGVALSRLNRQEECLAAYEEACRLQPDNGGWHGNRGIALGRLGRHEDALAAYEEACRLEPGNPSRLADRGVALSRLNRQEECLAAYEEACRLQPANASWHANRGVALSRLNRQEECLAAYEEACRLQPANASWHANRGVALSRLNRQEECLAAYEEACRLQPANASWHANRGNALSRLNRQEECLAAYEEACRLQPGNAGWHANRGLMLSRLERQEECLAAYEEACRLEPGNAGWHVNRGVALGRLDRYEDALAAYEEACRLEPGNAGWHVNRGVALGRLDRYEDALAAYEEACRLEPGNAGWHVNRGVALGRLDRYEDALAAYEEACRLEPANASWHGYRGNAFGRLERHNDALSAYGEACRLEPDNPDWHAHRGLALGRLNRYEESLAAYDEGLLLAPDAPNLVNNRGESLMMLQRDSEAVEAFRLSIDLDSGDCLESLVLLALLLCDHDMEQASELCRAALDMPGTRLTECRRGEMRALAQVIIGRPDEAERELCAALVRWMNTDVFQPRLYELLGVGKLEGGSDRLLRIWRHSGVIKRKNGWRAVE